MFTTAGICFSGCEKVNEGIDDSVVDDDGTDTTDFTDSVVVPELILDNDRIEVPVYGGNYDVSYKLVNPIDSIELKVESQDAWVNQLIQSEDKVAFTVDQAMMTDMRSTMIFFSYGDAKDTLSICQYASKNEIGISVTDVYDTAGYTISVTEEDPYVLCLREAEDYKVYDDRQLLLKLLQEDVLSGGTVSGSYSGTFRNLDSRTDYTIIAFGYENGFATTMPFKTEFTTPKIVGVNIGYKYFDGSALYESNPVTEYEQYWGKVVLVMTADPVGECNEYYYALLSPYMSKLNDEELIENLKASGSDEPVTVSLLQSVYYGTTQKIASVAVDPENGSCMLNKYEITFSKDGVSPIEEFTNTNL